MSVPSIFGRLVSLWWRAWGWNPDLTGQITVERRVLVWSGWIGLLLAFMPISTDTFFVVGLPFSPWFRYGANELVVNTPKDAPNETLPVGHSIEVGTSDRHPVSAGDAASTSTKMKSDSSWRFVLPNWSALLAILSIASLLLARWQRRRSEKISSPVAPRPTTM
jgi:hypothetical protein